MNFQYTIDPSSNEPLLIIGRHIGLDSVDGPGIDAHQLIGEIQALDRMGKGRIVITMNSTGGSPTDIFSIVRAVKSCRTQILTHNGGICCGGAERILASGSTRSAADYSLTGDSLMNAKEAKRRGYVDLIEPSGRMASILNSASPRACYRRYEPLFNSAIRTRKTGLSALGVMAAIQKKHNQ